MSTVGVGVCMFAVEPVISWNIRRNVDGERRDWWKYRNRGMSAWREELGEEWRHRKHPKKRKVALARLWSPQLHLDCLLFQSTKWVTFKFFHLRYWMYVLMLWLCYHLVKVGKLCLDRNLFLWVPVVDTSINNSMLDVEYARCWVVYYRVRGWEGGALTIRELDDSDIGQTVKAYYGTLDKV